MVRTLEITGESVWGDEEGGHGGPGGLKWVNDGAGVKASQVQQSHGPPDRKATIGHQQDEAQHGGMS